MMKFNYLLYILILLFFLFSCSGNKIEENESNNQFSKANPIQLNTTIKGNLNSIDDQDFFQFDLVEASVLSINLKRIKGFDLQLRVYQNSNLIKVIDDYQKNEGERIDNIFVNKGRCYVVVAPGKYNNLYFKSKTKLATSNLFPSDHYELMIKKRSIQYEEIEPNDNPKNAVTLRLNNPITGYFSPFRNQRQKDTKLIRPAFADKDLLKIIRYDFDWYQFQIPENGDHDISVKLEGVPNIDSAIAIYQEKRITFMNSNGIGEEEFIPNLSIKGNKVYYILVIGVNSYLTTSEKSYPYKLEVSRRSETMASKESEDNNSLEKANPLKEGVIHGLLSPKGDEDYYYIEINASDIKPFGDIEDRNLGEQPVTEDSEDPIDKLIQGIPKDNVNFDDDVFELVEPIPSEKEGQGMVQPLQPDSQPQREPKPEVEPQPKKLPVPDKQPEIEQKLEPEIELQPEIKPEPKKQPDPDQKVNPEIELEPEKKQQPKSQPEIEPKPEPQPKKQPVPDKQPQPKPKSNQPDLKQNNPKQNPKPIEDDVFKPISWNDKKITNTLPGQTIAIRKSLSAELSGVVGVDLELRLYDSNGTLLHIFDNEGDSQGEKIISYDVTNYKGVYLLVKGGKNNRGENSNSFYELSVHIQNHELFSDKEKIYELEPNDKKGFQISLDQEVYGFINTKSYQHGKDNLKGDLDLYTIELENMGKYKLLFRGVQGIDFQIKLFHSDNYRTPFKNLVIKGNSNQTRRILIDTIASNNLFTLDNYNTYFIEISSQFGKTANVNKPYSFVVKKENN